MQTKQAGVQEISEFYGEDMNFDDFIGLVGLTDGVVVCIAGLCFADSKPTIAISDFKDSVRKKDRVIFGRLSMQLIEYCNLTVWAVCSTPASSKLIEKIGFEFFDVKDDFTIMKWEAKNDQQ